VDTKEKAQLVLQLVKELVEESKGRNDKIGSLMRAFGDDYVLRMTTFSNFFQDKK
jgi:hypothetical protein